MTPEFLVLALEYARRPLLYPGLADPDRPLPVSFDCLVRDLSGALSPSQIQAAATALGCNADELVSAVRFTIRHILLPPGASHYRVLGVSRDAPAPLIEDHYHVLIGLLHPDRQPEEERDRAAADTARINTAIAVLRQPEARRQYDLSRPQRRLRRSFTRRRWRSLARLPVIGPEVQGNAGSTLARRLMIGSLVVGPLAFAFWLLLPPAPALRITADSTAGRPPSPAFLHAANPTPGSVSQRVTLSGLAGGSMPASSPKGPGQGRGAASPAALLNQLEIHLRTGDLDSVRGLLVDNAQITRAGQRDPEASNALFRATAARRLRLRDWALTRVNATRFRAQGVVQLADGDPPNPEHAAGPGAASDGPAAALGHLHLDIVAEGPAFAVSAIDYRFDPRP